MKHVVFFLLACVALATAAPQFINSWPGFFNPGYLGGLPNLSILFKNPEFTLVAGPTVYNGAGFGYGGRFIVPGYVGSALI